LSGPRGFAEGLSAKRLEESWVFARPENRNLPVPVLLSCAGHALSRRWLGPLVSYRVGHCLLMAATVGVLFGALGARYGGAVAALAAGSLMLMPHVFAHAHLNATDVPVSCFWILGILAWSKAASSWRAGLATALLCGVGLATKATFVLLPGLLVGWMLLFRQWSYGRAAAVLMGLAPLATLALCPMWWSDPLRGLTQYAATVSQADALWKIEVYYLGATYITGVRRLPWHNGWVMVAATTPPWTLLLVLVGAVRGLRQRDPSTGLWLMGAAVLPALRMLPGTPGHDGMRLMMPSVFCLAPLAGLALRTRGDSCPGLVHAATAARTRFRHRTRRLLVVLVLFAGGAAVVSTHPAEMSYYSEAIGGLSGASRLGFEVSYWFEGLSPAVLQEVQARLPAGTRVWVFPRYDGIAILRRWGLWRADLVDGDLGRADYLLLSARKARFYAIPGIEQLYRRGQPLWSLRCRGVQLVGLYKL
jgi:4-amino-4-deoxy-L-arabinose transferase-like glycosyltransferase